MALTTLMLSASLVLPYPLILGSGSATRATILREMGLRFEVLKPGIDEKAIRFSDPRELVMALGKAKAEALLKGEQATEIRDQRSLILTGDQVVVCNDVILEKPESAEQARAFINSYPLHSPRTVGSCIITDPVTSQQWCAIDEATVHFRPFPAETVDALIDEGEVFYCAGGLMVEHTLVAPYIEKMEGSMDTLMGLSKATVERLLGEALSARASN
jgi:septum formation protein